MVFTRAKKRRPAFRKRRRTIRRTRRYISRVPRRIPMGVSRYKFAKLPYCDLEATSVSASSSVAWTYQSSMYDPYAPVGGHQPMFFDQYAAMYRKYTVLGIAYDLQACTDGATTGPLVIIVTPSADSTPPTSISIARERPGSKEAIVSNSYRARLKGYMSVAKTLGVNRRNVLNDDIYSALVTTNPSALANLFVQAFNTSGGYAVAVYITLRLTYYVRFFDPQDPAQS